AGKRAVVTGGGRGIGRATAQLLARAGASVAVGYRSRAQDAEQTVRAITAEGVRGFAVAGDLGDSNDATRVVGTVVATLGAIDLLIVNHGVWPPADAPLARMSDAQWDSTRRANYDAMLYVCRAAIPHLPTTGG